MWPFKIGQMLEDTHYISLVRVIGTLTQRVTVRFGGEKSSGVAWWKFEHNRRFWLFSEAMVGPRGDLLHLGNADRVIVCDYHPHICLGILSTLISYFRPCVVCAEEI